MPRLPLSLSLLAAFAASAYSQVAYPVFETDKLSPAIYKERRERLKKELGPDSVAVIFTNPTRNRSNDTDFRYRPNSDFWYLTGFEEPDAAIILAPSGITIDGKKVTEVMFVNESNPMSETWLGYRMGPANAMKLLDIEMAVPVRNFNAVLPQLGNPATLYQALKPNDPTGGIQRMIGSFDDWAKGASGSSLKQGLRQTIGRMRVKKSKEEVALIQKAVDATVVAHFEAMRSIEPGMREWDIQAIVEYVFARHGSEAVAYNSIVGSGANSCILHYETNRRLMKAGDILCMDVGAEYHGYAADVTRSFPVNGKFSPEQRAIYNLVLAAQNAGIAECRPGRPFSSTDTAARKVIAEGLVRLGVTKTEREAQSYFMHGTSHHIGLDVHDPQGDNTLQVNHTLTVEPGIYIKPGSPCDPKWWNIGIRIEDDILVTEKGPVIMSGALPRRIEEIEAVMKDRGIGNIPLRGKK